MTPTLSPLDTVNLFADPSALMENLQAHFYLAKDYDYFINAIDTNIKRAFRYMESNPKLLQLSEDEITDSLRVALNMAGIPAEHDTMEGGHVDICIKSLRFKWLAEAKIKDDSYDYGWLWDGFMQLTERYATNTYECNKSGFLIYIKQPQSARVMARWKDHMSDKEGYTFSFEQISPLEFRSTHSHTRFGSDCLVTHYCLSIYFKPVV